MRCLKLILLQLLLNSPQNKYADETGAGAIYLRICMLSTHTHTHTLTQTDRYSKIVCKSHSTRFNRN